jgi:hypothetical protein
MSSAIQPAQAERTPSYDSYAEKEEKGGRAGEKVLPVADFTDPNLRLADPNLDPNEAAMEEDSPYPEVRSAVANTGEQICYFV